MKEYQIRLIYDLQVMKNNLLVNVPPQNQLVYSNLTYSVFETIIAHLMDKYKISGRDLRDYYNNHPELLNG